MERCDGYGGRSKGFLVGVTFMGEVYDSSKRLWVDKRLICPGCMRVIKDLWVPFRNCESCQGGMTNVDKD